MVRIQRGFPSTPGSLREARNFVVHAIAGTSPELLETVGLMVSELATNAQLHAATGFEVSAEFDQLEGRLKVEVTDTGAGEPTVKRPEPSDPHGRGLQIVAVLSDRWGIEWPSDRPGKTVWFEVLVPPSEPGDAAAQRRSAARAARAGDVPPAGPTVHESPSVDLLASSDPDSPTPSAMAVPRFAKSRLCASHGSHGRLADVS